jgi:superfamily II DNA or RNA helicase
VLTIIVDSHIRLRTNQVPDLSRLLSMIEKDMSIPNPAFLEAEKYNRSTRGIPRNLVLFSYDRVTKELSLPRGYTGRLMGLLEKQGIEYSLVDKRTLLPQVPFNSMIKLRPYQVPAVDGVLKGTQGILEAPAGSGKTEMGLEVVARVGQPTLWLTHTKDLAEQAISRAEARLGIPRQEIGMLGAGQERIGDWLTIGIIQKLIRMDLAPLINRFGLVLLDECHHSPAATWSEIINQFCARYRYGVTATLKRGDSLEVVTHRVIGPTLYQVPRSAVEASGGVIIPALRVIRTGIESEVWGKHQERDKAWKELRKQYKERGIREPQKPLAPYADILREILECPERNKFIIRILAQECPGHCSLVLSRRVGHCGHMANMLADVAPSLKIAVIHGKMGKKQREEIIEKMRSGELDVLFAVNIAKEGLDIPRLDRLFLVCSGRNEAEVEQMVGRIQRAYQDKEDAIVFDFVDEKIGMFQAQHWARRRVYRKLGMIPGKKKEAIS